MDAEERALWDAMQGPGRATARQALIERYMPLVYGNARAMSRNTPVEFDDLVQDGAFGLMQAVDRFDPARGMKFSTYAKRRIRGAMLDAIRARDWAPRLARQRGEAVPAMIPLGERCSRRPGRELALVDLLEAPREPDREDLRPWLRGLSRAEALALTLYHVDGLTMKEAGRVIGVQESRISQLLSQVHQRLRDREPEVCRA